MNFESEIYSYICSLNESGDMSIDIRFACLGDTNRFYSAMGHFVLTCVDYRKENDIEKIKLFLSTYLTDLWEHKDDMYNRIALYIENIESDGHKCRLSVGAALFNDPGITKD